MTSKIDRLISSAKAKYMSKEDEDHIRYLQERCRRLDTDQSYRDLCRFVDSLLDAQEGWQVPTTGKQWGV